MSRPRTLRATQVKATLTILDLMAADPQVGANELMRQLGAAGVKVGRTEALNIRRAVRAVLATAELAEVSAKAAPRVATESFCTTPATASEAESDE